MSEKKDYELAIDAFDAVAKEYKAMEEAFLSGDIVVEILGRCGNDKELIKREFQSYVELMKAKLDEHNTKLSEAKSAFRQVAQMSPNQERGPEGKSSTYSYGSLTVQSATRRSFDPPSLFKLAERFGIMDQLLALTYFDKDGKQVNLVRPTFEINYAGVLKWLQANNHQNIINGSYDEKEETPRVSGPRPLAFLGEKIEK